MSLRTLMTKAARACADEATRRFSPRRVLILCGPGNNGGDGLAMVPFLSKEAEVRVVLARPASQFTTPEARWAYDQVDPGRVAVRVFGDATRLKDDLGWADLVVDALLGSGTRGDLRGTIRTIVRAANQSRRAILSIDVPTGIGGRIAVRPKVTVALHDKKEGMTRTNSGTIVVRDIGIPEAAGREVGPGDFTVPYPRNPIGSHKGQNGTVLIVSGGPYTGAPTLCALGALRSGADLVRLYAPRHAALVAQVASPDLVVRPGVEDRRLVKEDARHLRSLYPRSDALLIGPGLGDDPETETAVLMILRDAKRAGLRLIVDADALVVAGRDPRFAARLGMLATPHAGEFRELTGRSVPKDLADQETVAVKEARRLRATILLKGPVGIITDGQRAKLNRCHDPRITVGGTGDVLAGVAAGLAAKGMPLFRAACAAAYVSGTAQRMAAKRQGSNVLATDIVGFIPRVFRDAFR